MKNSPFEKLILFDIDYTLFDTDLFKKSQLKEHSVYEEVREVLNKLLLLANLGIFSEGKIELQKTKLKKTDIEKYFKKELTHIVEKKEEELKKILSKYKDNMLFLVDDKLTILCRAFKLLPSLKTIWVKRGRYAQGQKPIKGFSPTFIIRNLEELIPIISSK